MSESKADIAIAQVAAFMRGGLIPEDVAIELTAMCATEAGVRLTAEDVRAFWMERRRERDGDDAPEDV